MKTYPNLLIPLILLAIVLFTGCEEMEPFSENTSGQTAVGKDYPPVRNLDYEVVDDLDGQPGGGLHLRWDPPDGAIPQVYVVRVDGMDQPPVKTTEDYVYTPGMIVAVIAVYADGESKPEELDFEAVETPSLDVWSVADPLPEHPSGLGFGPDGTASSYAVSYPENWPSIDYYIDHDEGPFLSSPNSRELEPLNEEENTSCLSDFAYVELMIVIPCDQHNYSSKRRIYKDDVFGLWLDPDADGYSTNDHFGKAKVLDAFGNKVTLKLAYQTVPGLRWVATEEGSVGIEED